MKAEAHNYHAALTQHKPLRKAEEYVDYRHFFQLICFPMQPFKHVTSPKGAPITQNWPPQPKPEESPKRKTLFALSAKPAEQIRNIFQKKKQLSLSDIAKSTESSSSRKNPLPRPRFESDEFIASTDAILAERKKARSYANKKNKSQSGSSTHLTHQVERRRMSPNSKNVIKGSSQSSNQFRNTAQLKTAKDNSSNTRLGSYTTSNSLSLSSSFGTSFSPGQRQTSTSSAHNHFNKKKQSFNRYEGLQGPRRFSIDDKFSYTTSQKHISINPNVSLELNLKKASPDPTLMLGPPPTVEEAERHFSPSVQKPRSKSLHPQKKVSSASLRSSAKTPGMSQNLRKSGKKQKKKTQKKFEEPVERAQVKKGIDNQEDVYFVDYTVIPLLLRADMDYRTADDFGRVLKRKYSAEAVQAMMRSPFELFAALEEEGFKFKDSVKFNIVDDEFWKNGVNQVGNRTSFVFYKDKTGEKPKAVASRETKRPSFARTKASLQKVQFEQEKIYNSSRSDVMDAKALRSSMQILSIKAPQFNL